jgi:hypothetical protein
MHKDVPHANDGTPWNVRMRRFPVLRQSACGLTDNLQVVHNPVLDQLVTVERVPSCLCIALDSLNRLGYVA